MIRGALESLSKEGPEPSYLIIERERFQLLVEAILNANTTRDAKLLRTELRELKEYAEELTREADSLSLEEKETMMGEVLKRRGRASPE